MPDSEDEFALLNEVDILVTKIKARPEIHFDAETDADIRKRIRANESLEVRLTKWQSRLTNQPSKIAECWEFWTFWRATCCVSRRDLLRPCSVDGATQAYVFSLASSYPMLQKKRR